MVISGPAEVRMLTMSFQREASFHVVAGTSVAGSCAMLFSYTGFQIKKVMKLAKQPCKIRAKKKGAKRISLVASILATCACTLKPQKARIKLVTIA